MEVKSRNRVAILVNPASGKGIGFRKARTAKKILERAGREARLLATQAMGHGRLLAADNAGWADVFISVGGDGTLNEVVTGLGDVPCRKPIAIIPTGTANVVARELGIPSDFQTQLALALYGRIRCLDAGLARNRRFVMSAGVGFDAAIVNSVSRRRANRPMSMMSWLIPILMEIRRYHFPRMRVNIDGVLVEERATFTLIGNTVHYGARVLRPFREARPDDGVLNICCFRGTRTVDLLRYLMAACARRLWALSDVTEYTGKEILIDSRERVFVQLDGDPGGELPMAFKILPGAVDFCVS